MPKQYYWEMDLIKSADTIRWKRPTKKQKKEMGLF